jgi:tetratricopeptide (TPR) repeat protein
MIYLFEPSMCVVMCPLYAVFWYWRDFRYIYKAIQACCTDQLVSRNPYRRKANDISMKMPKYTRKIERYFEGRLSKRQREKFEADLLVNQKLKEEYQIFQSLVDYAREKDADESISDDPAYDLPRSLTMPGNSRQAFGREVKGENDLRIRYIKAGLAVAAGLAILFSITQVIRISQPDTSLLYAQYTGRAAELAVGGYEHTDIVGREILNGINQYIDGDYNSALLTFKTIDAYTDDFPEIKLFKGLIYLEKGENQEALVSFSEAAKQDGTYRKYARWFRSLAYVRLIHPDVAVLFIIERADFYHGLSPSFQNMIRRANLASTCQFRELRKELNPEQVDKPLLITRKDVIIFIILLIVVVLFPLLTIIDLLVKRFSRFWRILYLLLILCVPVTGPLVYLYTRKFRMIKAKGE